MSIADKVGDLLALRARTGRPPSDAQTVDIRLPVRLPAEVLDALQRIAGTEDMWIAPERHHDVEASEGQFDYGAISFMSIAQMSEEHADGLDLAPGLEAPGFVVGPARATYFERRRLPFALDVGGGRFAIDMNPTSEGTKGQILWFDIENSTLRVVAPSFEEFLEYGCACVRHELQPNGEPPTAPFSESNAALVSNDPACARILDLWQRIVAASRSRPPVSELIPLEFHRPAALKQIERVEARLRVPFPTQLRYFHSIAGISSAMWLEPGKYDRYPITLGGLSDIVAFDRTTKDHLRHGHVTWADPHPLPVRFALAYFGGAGWIKEGMHFYVLCTAETHPLTGAVLVEYSEAQESRLSVSSPDVEDFLRRGLSRIERSGARGDA